MNRSAKTKQTNRKTKPKQHWSDRIFTQQNNDQIPPIAYLGALVFILFWIGTFNLGIAAGF